MSLSDWVVSWLRTMAASIFGSRRQDAVDGAPADTGEEMDLPDGHTCLMRGLDQLVAALKHLPPLAERLLGGCAVGHAATSLRRRVSSPQVVRATTWVGMTRGSPSRP